jgi:hypothetical protein
MAPPPGRVGGTVKLPVHVRMFPEESAAVDAFAAELSQQSYGAAFSRAEALRIAAMGFDHGVGHSLLLLYDAKAPCSQNSRHFNGLGHYPSNILYKFIIN